MRLVGATAPGPGLAGPDRLGRKTPLMISILWYSICQLSSPASRPPFTFLLIFPHAF